ncbi:MAG: hypothetical protein RI885_1031 [Actinomycetota bacterium]|jgi:cytidyltransferase-like protein
MVGDLFHAGHVALLRSAREFGDEVIVGVLSDDSTAAYKRVPIMTLSERTTVIAACRYVDEVVEDAPSVLTAEFLAEHRISFVVHGDDTAPSVLAEVYGPAIERGMLRLVPYTAGVSTTDLIARVLGSDR